MSSVAESAAQKSEESAPGVGEKPFIRIHGGGRAIFDLRELIAYRELLYFLVWRDVKVRYKQTVLGIGWALIQPIFTMLLFTVIFGRLAGVRSDGIHYPLFVYAGLALWTFFSTAVTSSSNSLVGSANLISKVYFPRLLIPTATVGAALVDLAIALVVLVGMMGWYRVEITTGWLLAPLFVVLTALLAVATGIWLAALNVRYRDVRHAVPFAVQLWMFASPVIYPSSMIPERWRWVLTINPLTGVLEGFRASLFGRPIDWPPVAISALAIGVVLVSGVLFFQRTENTFADVV